MATITESLSPGTFTGLLQTIPVRLRVLEVERIGGRQIRKVFLVAAFVEEGGQAFGGAQSEMVRALRADVQAGFEVLLVDQLSAARTLDPQALGDAARFFSRLRRDRLAGLLEPSHSWVLTQFKFQKSKRHAAESLCGLHLAVHAVPSGTRDVVLRTPAHGVDLPHQVSERVVAAREIEL